MDITKPVIFRCLFKAVCTVCVVCMVGYWFYKFDVEDRDVGIVDYTSFEDDSRIAYPVASLCFVQPFSREKVSQMTPELDTDHYLNYLKGDVVEEEFQDVNYWNITLELDEYLNFYAVTLRNGTYLQSSKIAIFSHKVNFNGFSEYGWFYKCFESIWKIAYHGSIKESYVIYNKTKILQDAMINDPVNFQLYIHYPGQFLLAPNDLANINMPLNEKSLEILIEDVEILKSRNSKHRRCTVYDDKKYFDDLVKEMHIIQNECILPYFKSFKNFPKCNTSEKIRSSAFKYPVVRTKYYPISCQRLSKIAYQRTWVDNAYLGFEDDELAIGIIYPQYFRSIELTKAVDVHSLVGNIGGYVGLFLGICSTISECE